jgi:RNA polymerase sigma-70 factor (ECF subfamily)
MRLHDEVHNQFQLVFREHYNKLCTYAFSFLKEHDSCKDIVQDVFVKIWETRPDLLTSETLRFYLFTAVRNNCLTYLQKNKRLPIVELADEHSPADQMTLSGQEENAEDPVKMIARAMDQLPPKCREVFLLSRVSELSYQQIADSLDISVKTVENQIGKALKLLRSFSKNNSLKILASEIFIGIFSNGS